MFDDVAALRAFYQTGTGKSVRNLLSTYIAPFWQARADAHNAALGYGIPFLPESRDGFAFLPMRRGPLTWPETGPVRTSLIDPHYFPLQDVQLDRLLLIHALEFDEDPARLLSEACRSLDGGGRLMVVVPHRLGLWAQVETTPFGHGQPFTGRQLRQLLVTAGFDVTKLYSALFVPPLAGQWPANIQNTIETAGKRWVKLTGGLLVAEANKLLYAPAGNTSKLRGHKGLKKPRLVPQSSRSSHPFDNC